MDTALARLRAENPVPDPAALPHTPVEGGEFLALVRGSNDGDGAWERPLASDLPTARSGLWSRPVAVVAAAALGVLVLLGGFALLIRSPDTAEPGGQPTPSPSQQPSPLPAQEPMPPVSAGPLSPELIPFELAANEWSRVPDEMTGFSRWHLLVDVVSGGPGLLGTGHDGSTSAFFESTDGTEWTRVRFDEPDPQFFGRVIAANGDFLLPGQFMNESGDVEVGVWKRSDGSWDFQSFNLFTEIDAESGPVFQYGDVGISGDGTNAVALVNESLAWPDEGQGVRALISGDGETWSEVPDAEGVFENATVFGVVRLHDGYVAVGGAEDNDYNFTAWTSADGTGWTRAPVTGEPPSSMGMLMEIAQTPTGILVGGRDSAGPVAWLSVDGRDWTRLGGLESMSGDGILRIATTGSAFLILGEEGVWLSEDGSEWELFAFDPGFTGPAHEIHDVTAVDGVLVVVGSTTDPTGDPVGAVWLRPLD